MKNQAFRRKFIATPVEVEQPDSGERQMAIGWRSLVASALLMVAAPTSAAELRGGGKLLLTRGVSAIEGAGGGGLASWALIGGNATRDGIGGQAHATYVVLPDYELRAGGVAIGLFDRVELSVAKQSFDTGRTGARLGLGRGFTFDQHIFGA